MNLFNLFKNKKKNRTRVVTVPSVLYRFRSLNEYTISSLKNNSIYVAKPHMFNDIFETSFLIEQRELSDKEEMELVEKRKEKNFFASRLFKDEKTGFFKFKSTPNNVSDINNPAQYVFDQWKAEFSTPALECGIACLSERVDSIPMWAHYADNHEGICIEYVPSDNLFTRLRNLEFSLLPVIYHEKTLVFDPMYLVNTKERLLVEAIAQYKSADWSYEREWRLITTKGGELIENPFRCTKVIFGHKVTADAVGRVISAIGGDADVSYFVCDKNQINSQLRIIPLEYVFGPIIHKNSIFKEMSELAEKSVKNKKSKS